MVEKGGPCITFVSQRLFMGAFWLDVKSFVLFGESAGARTQDQRLKRAMLYQLSYALKPLSKVSTSGG